MSNLWRFELCNVPADKISLTQLLDFFEGAPLLRDILIEEAFPDSSDVASGRTVALPSLAELMITIHPLHIIVLNHLLTPTGAVINQGFNFINAKSPIHSLFPKDFKNLKHLSNITSMNLNLSRGVYLALEGPSGGHKIYGDWTGQGLIPINICCIVLQSLDVFTVSSVEKLAITHWQFAASQSVAIEKPSIYRTFHLMNNLCTLTPIVCHNLPFMSTLNPKENRSGTVPCPKLQQLFVHITRRGWFCLEELLVMAEERSS